MAKMPTINIELQGLDEKIDINHIRGLLQAEQDGRLVVLPCNVGRTVYKLGHYHDCSDNLYETCELFAYDDGACSHCYKDKLVPHICEAGFELSMLEELGKTVFLTREEAEAALKHQLPGDTSTDTSTAALAVEGGEG